MQRVKAFSAPHVTPAARGCTRSKERAELGQLTMTDHGDIPDHVVVWPC